MVVKLLHHTPLWVCSTAIRKCWASEGRSDTDCDQIAYPNDFGEAGAADKALIDRIGNKNKHASTLEHLTYNFDIDGISRACLQELARHRMASLSVKSTRYTLKEAKQVFMDNYGKITSSTFDDFLVKTGNDIVDEVIVGQLYDFLECYTDDTVANDIAKYMLPEAYKTSLVWTINARSLQNFLALRTSPSALWEIRDLANELYSALPEEHKYLFTETIYKEQ